MSDRLYRLNLGLIILVCLYFELDAAFLALIVVILFEGIFNLRITTLTARVPVLATTRCSFSDIAIGQFNVRHSFEAERAWRILVPVLLGVTHFAFNEYLWWASWFMGFAILGAGASGVCPMKLFFQFLGFK